MSKFFRNVLLLIQQQMELVLYFSSFWVSNFSKIVAQIKLSCCCCCKYPQVVFLPSFQVRCKIYVFDKKVKRKTKNVDRKVFMCTFPVAAINQLKWTRKGNIVSAFSHRQTCFGVQTIPRRPSWIQSVLLSE